MNILESCQESLESIIKIEPEEFEATTWKQNGRQTADHILRSKANIFSDPILLLERHTIDTPTLAFDSDGSHSEKVKTFVRRGNAGLGSLDPHTCCLCQRVFSIRRTLRVHLENVHLKTKRMFCDLCPKFYFTKAAISQHMREVHKGSFERHELTHAAKVECPVCNKVVASLKVHMRAHRPKVSCKICQKMVTKGNLKKHIKIHARAAQKCKNCDEAFGNREELRRHDLRKHHHGKLFECHCGSVYKSNQKLKRHEQSHNDEKPTCEVCQKQFSSINSLKCHWIKMHQGPSTGRMRVLSRNGPFICDKCGSKLSFRNSFIKHIQSHKSAAMFDCDLCPRSFNQKQNLVSHIESVHLKIRSFKCEICNYSSFSRRDLKSHMLQHGSKTECSVCHKLVSNLYTHLKTHVKVKCPICSKVYSKISLLRHIRTHDNKKICARKRY